MRQQYNKNIRDVFNIMHINNEAIDWKFLLNNRNYIKWVFTWIINKKNNELII